MEKKHSISIESRSKTQINGVEKVADSSSTHINVLTSEGMLFVKGNEIKILAFSVENGTLSFEGRIDKIEYSASKKPLLRRLFK